ncbi:protein of unknown function [Methylorubrum extorquens]|uniref:Uncharacterized protein n=1 Tax=Methylorubrum extorquens TaxID=408 RepID=A0A2N9AZH2_METEX|nr:protein of unknown function [Methylorubrum extorquens]
MRRGLRPTPAANGRRVGAGPPFSAGPPFYASLTPESAGSMLY